MHTAGVLYGVYAHYWCVVWCECTLQMCCMVCMHTTGVLYGVSLQVCCGTVYMTILQLALYDLSSLSVHILIVKR